MKARAVNLVGFGPLTHRLDEYLSGMNTVDAQHADDLVAFADRISALLDGEKVALDDVATVLRQLLQQNSFNRAAEHTSELQSLMRTSYAVLCLNTQKKQN